MVRRIAMFTIHQVACTKRFSWSNIFDVTRKPLFSHKPCNILDPRDVVKIKCQFRIWDTIKRNDESDVANIVFEILANTVFKFFCLINLCNDMKQICLTSDSFPLIYTFSHVTFHFTGVMRKIGAIV